MDAQNILGLLMVIAILGTIINVILTPSNYSMYPYSSYPNNNVFGYVQNRPGITLTL